MTSTYDYVSTTHVRQVYCGATEAAVTTSAVDTMGGMSVALVINAQAAASRPLGIALQESDNNSTWTPVAASDLIGAPESIVNRACMIGYKGCRRYIRAILTPGAGSDEAVTVAVTLTIQGLCNSR